MTALPLLPVDAAMPSLLAALEGGCSAVLVAPPGAGKTTRVPLALLDAAWVSGRRIIVLEPRRLAARAAANHVAALLGERPGATVGYRVRMESRTGPATRIEFVTEGVFTRMALADPELGGVAAIIFDEFHERSLESDFGLALALDIQSALRPDLRILPMSATIDGAAVSALLGSCPVIESHGRTFPVETRYLPGREGERIEEKMVSAIRQVLVAEPGSILCFLPGQAEILRVAARLGELLDSGIVIAPLYGALEPAEQDRAIRPAPEGKRKVVLATSIAETSITIEGVRTVIDSGLARVPRFEPDSGLTRLVTVRASRASVDQRAGRAGRTAPGIALRLWHEGQTGSLRAQERPEILEADLSGLVLGLAGFGVTRPDGLKWMDPPPGPAWNEATSLLGRLGALDDGGAITQLGRDMLGLALAPRLSRMVTGSGETGQAETAARLALLLGERGLGGSSPDLQDRLERLAVEKGARAERARTYAASIARHAGGTAGSDTELSAGALLSLAYPDRIARNAGTTQQGANAFLLANGRRAIVEPGSPLAGNAHIVAADIQGSAASARILSGAAIGEEEIHRLHGRDIKRERQIALADDRRRLQARETLRLGAITLSSVPVRIEPSDDPARHLLEAVREHGIGLIGFGPRSTSLRARLAFLHHHLPERFADTGDDTLLARLGEWLAPVMNDRMTSLADITDDRLAHGLAMMAGVSSPGEIEKLVPGSFVTPAGSRIALRYEGEQAILAVKVQELFGMRIHPAILGGRVPLRIELLSPAMRPIQTTANLPGFWAGSWKEVRTQMRGRYPKHFWPENPAEAPATTRAKPKPG